jgi:L-rhamnose-H+ transport protein
LRQPPGILFSNRGLAILLGVALMCLGVSVCAIAGMRREGNTPTSAGANKVKGIVLCLISGVTSASLNFALIYGSTLQLRAQARGYSPGVSSNAVWTWAMAGSFLVNLGYCLYLMRKNQSAGRYRLPQTSSYWFYCLVMAILLSGGIFVYGYGAASVGVLGATIGWAIFLCCTILAANVSGFITGEWRGVTWGITRLMIAGSGILIVAAVVVGYAAS